MTSDATPRFGARRAIACLAIACGACGAPSGPASDPSAARAPSEIHHLLGTPSSFHRKLSTQALEGYALPTLHLRVHRLEAGGLATEAPISFDVDHTASFLPLVRGAPVADCRMTLDAETDGDRVPLWSGAPRFTRTPARGLDPLVAVLDDRVFVSVHALTGRSARLRWRVEGACASRVSWIAAPKLRVSRPQQRPAPSMLLVCSDQHRYDRAIGPEGEALMPRLAALARSGVVYDAAYSSASWTLPSIVSTLTGLFPRFHRTGLRLQTGDAARQMKGKKLPPGQFLAGWGDDVHVLTAYPKQLTTLGERLQDVGYDTVAIVSNDFYVLSGLAADGFDVVIDTGPVEGGAVNDQALAVLKRRARAPSGGDGALFLFVHYMDVHEYLRGRVPAARSALVESDLDPVALRGWYDNAVRATDRHLGELLDAWDSGADADETLVAFYSDHGEHLQERGHLHDRHGDSMDEVLLRVPLVARFPASRAVAPGREARPVHLVDLAPTVLDVAGAAWDASELNGRSLLALAAAGDTAPRALHADYQLYGDELASVRRGDRKLVLDVAKNVRRLIDVAATEGGEHAAVRSDPEAERDLERVYREYVERSDRFAKDLASDRVFDPDEVERRLHAIGYVE